MRITPVSSGASFAGVQMDSGAIAIEPRQQVFKMNTNATPGRLDEEPTEQPPAQELSISDANNDQAKPATEETQPLSPQLVALAKQRRALQVKEREIADRERAFAEKSSTGGSIDLAQLKSNPLGVLLDAGVTYEQLANEITTNQHGYNPEVFKLKEELKSLKDEVKGIFSERDAAAEQRDQAIARSNIDRLVAQGEDYAIIRETASVPIVMKLLARAKREGNPMTEVEALQAVEKTLHGDVLKAAMIQKVRSQLTPAEAQAPQTPPQQQRQMKTLTNRDTVTAPLSRKARAFAAWNGTLK